MANPLGTDPDPLHPRTYQIGFAAQSSSGSYTVTLSSSIQSEAATRSTRTRTPGSTCFSGRPRWARRPLRQLLEHDGHSAGQQAATVTSSLTIPTSFLVQGLTVALDITYPNDPDLEVFLTSPDGTTIELIKNAGAADGANFSGTILTDTASTSIQNGSCAVHRPVPAATSP